MIKKDDIKILKTLLKQTKTNRPFLEVSSKYRQLTGKTPGGELFRIIVREEKGKLYLLTFYPARAG